MTEWDKKDTTHIRIPKHWKVPIKGLSEKYGYKQITVVDYLFKGEISVKELQEMYDSSNQQEPSGSKES